MIVNTMSAGHIAVCSVGENSFAVSQGILSGAHRILYPSGEETALLFLKVYPLGHTAFYALWAKKQQSCFLRYN